MESTKKEASGNHSILDDYMLHLKLSNRSQNTLKTYERLLQHFFTDVARSVDQVTSDDVLRWLQAHQTGKKETTIATWLSILSAFFTFCEIEDYIEQNPIKSRWRPKTPKPVPKYLERDEQASLRLLAESVKLRDQVLYELLVSSGCRITEVLTLKKEAIQLEDRIATVQGKGGKIRQVHFSYRCQILLERHLNQLPQDATSIFLNVDGGRLSRMGAHKQLSKMGKTADLSAPFGPHRLRHTFATNLLSKGAELAFISEELGHSHLSTTRVYARLPKEDLIRMYRKYMG